MVLFVLSDQICSSQRSRKIAEEYRQLDCGATFARNHAGEVPVAKRDRSGPEASPAIF